VRTGQSRVKNKYMDRDVVWGQEKPKQIKGPETGHSGDGALFKSVRRVQGGGRTEGGGGVEALPKKPLGRLPNRKKTRLLTV